MPRSIQQTHVHLQRYLRLAAILSCCALVTCEHPSGLPVCDTGDIRSESVAFWNGMSWEAMGNGLPGFAWDVAVDSARSIVYCGGSFNLPGTSPGGNIAQWSDATRKWLPVGGGINGGVRALQFYNDKLYVGGSKFVCLDSNGRKVAFGPLAAWNGSQWESILYDDCLHISYMAVHDNRIFMIATIVCDGLYDCFCEFDLASQKFTVIGKASGTIHCFERVGDWIYVGGRFSRIDTLTTPMAARWNIRSRQWEGIEGFCAVTGQYQFGITEITHIPESSYLFVTGEFSLANNCNGSYESPVQIDLQTKSVAKLKFYMGGVSSFVPTVSGGYCLGGNYIQSGLFEYFKYPETWLYMGGVCTTDKTNRISVPTSLARYKNGVVVVGKFDYIVLPK